MLKMKKNCTQMSEAMIRSTSCLVACQAWGLGLNSSSRINGVPSERAFHYYSSCG